MSGKIRLKGASSGYVDITAPDSGANTTLNTGLLIYKDSANGTITGVSTSDLTEGTKLYYTTARFDSDFGTKDLHDSALVQAQFDSALPVALASDVSLGNITTTGYLRGPSTFVVDPATHGDDTGTLRVAGNLTVDGTTTTINSTTVTTADKNIVIAQGAADSAAADGAGITIDTVNASLTYSDQFSAWNSNRELIIDVDTTNEVSGPSQGNSSGLTIRDAATDSDSICGIKFSSSDAGGTPRHCASIAAQKTGQWPGGTGNYPGALTFWTRPSSGVQAERMRIDKDGNIGIGTSSPSNKLHVNGDLLVQDSATFDTMSLPSGFRIYQVPGNTHLTNMGGGSTNGTDYDGAAALYGGVTSGQGGGFVAFGQDHATNPGCFKIHTSSGLTMHGDSTGNVGIGTSSPGRKLHISGSGATVAAKVEATDGSQASIDLTNTEGAFRIINDAGTLQFWDDDASLTLFGADSAGTLHSRYGIVVGTVPQTKTHRTLNNSGITMRGGTSDGLLGVQDGNGRMQLKWNATNGTSEKYLVSNEKAFFWDMTITSSPIWEMKYGAGGTADSAISWSVLLDLTSSGDLEATGDVIAYSDERLKENIEIIPNALEKIEAIDGVTFTRKDEAEDFIGRRRAGVIAQQVEKVLPEVVTENKEGTKQVAYGNMVGLLVEAIKELKAEIEELKK